MAIMRTNNWPAARLALCVLLASCTTGAAPASPATPPTVVTVEGTSSSTIATTSTSTTTPSPTTATPTTTLRTTEQVLANPLDLSADVVTLGASVEGRTISAERLGEAGDRRVLVIGVIHGDEDDGLAIIQKLRNLGAPDNAELWLVESMNPDGVAHQVRQNANRVDLNRNFPYKWGPIGVPGDSQYAGTGPASEPETQAIVNLIDQLRPDIVIWYHQDLFIISPSTGRDGRIRARYAELTGLPIGAISGGTYTGVAATWARHALSDQGSVAFIVELGATLSDSEALTHANAVRTIASEG